MTSQERLVTRKKRVESSWAFGLLLPFCLKVQQLAHLVQR